MRDNIAPFGRYGMSLLIRIVGFFAACRWRHGSGCILNLNKTEEQCGEIAFSFAAFLLHFVKVRIIFIYKYHGLPHTHSTPIPRYPSTCCH